MCKARFGILNDLYNDLVNDGIDDVEIIGINGFQYIDDSIDCMICADECESSTCDSGPRILPWVQDYDDGINCQNDNFGLCQGGDEVSDVWDLWDISLRDLVTASPETKKKHQGYLLRDALEILEACQSKHDEGASIPTQKEILRLLD